MIETVMIFALGFLGATLLALLTLPAVSARAARLTKRRIDATLPLSVGEIEAEKDYLRAQAAIAQRRLERKVEAARGSRQADMAVIGARTMEAAALARVLETREAEIASVTGKADGLEADLGAARAEGVVGAATLSALEDAHRALLDDFLDTRAERIATSPTTEAATGDALAGVDLRARHDALVSERETLRASLAAAEAALARTDPGPASQPDTARDQADAELRLRITEVAEALTRPDRLPAVGAFTLTGVTSLTKSV